MSGQDIDIAWSINGLEAVINKLHRIPVEVEKKALPKGMRAGANVVRRAAIANAAAIDSPKTPNRQIYKNIVVQFAPRYSRSIGGVVMRVGVLGGARQYGRTKQNVRLGRVGKSYKTLGDKGNPGGDTWYWRFVEFGVPSRGIPARPFLLPALEHNTGSTMEAITTSLEKSIDHYVASLRGIGGK